MSLPNHPVTEFSYADTSRLSWNSIFAGVLIVITGSALFNLLGMSIGLTLFQPKSEMLPALTWGTIIWVMISAVLSMYAGGWVASYCSTGKTPWSATVSGIITSSLSLLIFFVITATVSGSILSTTFSALNTIISTGASGVASSTSMVINTAKGINKVAPELGDNVKKALPDLDPIIAKINKKAGELLPQNNEMPEEKAKKIKSQLEEFVSQYLDALGKGDANIDEVTKDFNKFLVETTGKSPEEINSILNEWKKTYFEAKEKAHQTMLKTSEMITKTLSRLAFINFLLIVISLGAAVIGSRHGLKCRE